MDLFDPQVTAGYFAGDVKKLAMEEQFHFLKR
jgi:hypothetical protein